jgi:hypothetical protein
MSADDMTNQLSLPPSDPAFLQAWNFMENQQMACSMESMFVMSDNSLSSDFTMFQDQSWFM